jgi:branched-chain amino acid transport system substrate-binding protein
MIGRRTPYWVLITAVLGGLLVVACQAGNAKVARVVVSLPLQGSSPDTQSVGERIKQGIQLAFDEVGPAQVGGPQLDLVILDDGDEAGQWQPDKEADNAQQAVGEKSARADETALAYLGPYHSGAAKVSIPILNRAGLLQISSSATWPGLTKPGFAQSEPGIFYPTGQLLNSWVVKVHLT